MCGCAMALDQTHFSVNKDKQKSLRSKSHDFV